MVEMVWSGKIDIHMVEMEWNKSNRKWYLMGRDGIAVVEIDFPYFSTSFTFLIPLFLYLLFFPLFFLSSSFLLFHIFFSFSSSFLSSF